MLRTTVACLVACALAALDAVPPPAGGPGWGLEPVEDGGPTRGTVCLDGLWRFLPVRTTAVIPVARLSPDFFRLGTGLAGALLQKFTNYHLRVAIVGDISAYTDKSAPLRDFVRESNRRGQVRFLASEAEL